MREVLIFALTLLIFTSCLDEPDCIRQALDEVSIGFNDKDNGDDISVQIDSVMLVSLDTSLYKDQATGSIELSLDALNETTSVVIHSNFGVDTVVLGYNTVTRLISPNCGAETFFTELEIISSTADSIKIVNREVFRSSREFNEIGDNVQIFY